MVCNISCLTHFRSLPTFYPRLLTSLISTLHTDLAGFCRGGGLLKAVEVVLKSASKGYLTEDGAWILNRTEKGGERRKRQESHLPHGECRWGVDWQKRGEHTWPFFLSDPEEGSWALRRNGRWHVERRRREGLDTPISIWKVEACIDELNRALWPHHHNTHTHTHTHTHTYKWCALLQLKGCGSCAASFYHLFLSPLSYNGGICVDGVNWFRCECAPGFAGPDCRISE